MIVTTKSGQSRLEITEEVLTDKPLKMVVEEAPRGLRLSFALQHDDFEVIVTNSQIRIRRKEEKTEIIVDSAGFHLEEP